MGPLQRSLLLCAFLYCLYPAGLGNLGFIGPDEPRYADVARTMLNTGDYVTPHLFGAPWFEKPPLYYWMAALAFRMGVNEVSARLPSVLAAVAFLGFWFWFGTRFYGDCAAKFSCIMLATTVGYVGFARAAAMDMLLTTSLSAALGLWAFWLWEKDARGLYGFYALLAVATLAKGPLAIGLAGLVVGGYIIHRREWHLIPKMLFTPAVVIFLGIALPWYIVCYARNGGAFIQEFFIKHNLERLVSAEAIGHGQPWWYYLPILPAALFPWSLALLLPVREFIKRGWREVTEHAEIVLLLYWVVLPFLFFSVSKNKLPGYLLPILPPLTLWIGHAISLHWDEEADGSARFVKVLLAISALLLLAAPFIALMLPDALAFGLREAMHQFRGATFWRDLTKGAVPLIAWILVLALVTAAVVLQCYRKLLAGAFAGAVAVAFLVFLLALRVAPSINRVASVRTAAQRFGNYGVQPGNLAVFYLNRNQVYGLGYYLESLPPEWIPEKTPEQIEFLAAHEDIRVDEIRPGAHPITLFPGLHLRLWELNPEILIIPQPVSLPRP